MEECGWLREPLHDSIVKGVSAGNMKLKPNIKSQ